jgi:hypothetical protein
MCWVTLVQRRPAYTGPRAADRARPEGRCHASFGGAYTRRVPALIGVIAIVLGIISLAKRDWMWNLTRIGNDMEGEVSNRNDLWELRTIVGGVVLIVFGLILIAFVH